MELQEFYEYMEQHRTSAIDTAVQRYRSLTPLLVKVTPRKASTATATATAVAVAVAAVAATNWHTCYSCCLISAGITHGSHALID
jgi:dihydroorotate dehydrogenase